MKKCVHLIRDEKDGQTERGKDREYRNRGSRCGRSRRVLPHSFFPAFISPLAFSELTSIPGKPALPSQRFSSSS
jgi:hypothetical protein